MLQMEFYLQYNHISFIISTNVEWQHSFLGLWLEFVISIGWWLIKCYTVISAATCFQFFAAITAWTETVLVGFCILTV